MTTDEPGVCRRVAMVSVHTSPLAQPGTGDAGGMNVYVLESARRLARRGVAVDIFTRRTRKVSVGQRRWRIWELVVLIFLDRALWAAV